MKLMLTSDFGGSDESSGKRLPTVLIQKNGLLENLKKMWKPNSNVLMISANSDDHILNDGICGCYKKAFPMSSLSVSNLEMCDERNPEISKDLSDVDVLVLFGGHLPTQNRFINQIDLKKSLETFDGLILSLSAGTMNCADNVYICPELEGEALDPNFIRWSKGLGLTDINVFPHYQYFKGVTLDGLRFVEDIVFPDSFGHEFLALNDGSYVIIDNGISTLYGEAYKIFDGKEEKLCADGESAVLQG